MKPAFYYYHPRCLPVRSGGPARPFRRVLLTASPRSYFNTKLKGERA
ncbi:MAG: hypothetical protein ACK5NK_07860 [Niabella sp.]